MTHGNSSRPRYTVLAWDVAFTPDGPVVIEANDIFDLDVSQLPADRGLLGTALRVHLSRQGALRFLGLRRRLWSSSEER